MAKKNYIGQLLTGGQPSGNTSKNNKTGTSGIYGTVSMPSGIGSTVNVNTTSNPANVGSLSSATSVIPPKPPVTAIQPSNLTTTTGAITNSALKNILANSIASVPTQNSTPTQPSTGTSSAGTSPTATPAQSTNPYLDANEKIAEMINKNYADQLEAVKLREKDALDKIESGYNDWVTGKTDLFNSYRKRMEDEEAAANVASNALYDRTARQNYINYRQAEKRLPSQLNALGIRGGAAESSLIRLGSNYGTNVANNEMARAQALDSISKQYTEIISNAETELRQAILARDDAKAQQIASVIDSSLKEQASIEAAKNDALTNAYATASDNAIAYDIAKAKEAKDDERWLMTWNREGDWHDKAENKEDERWELTWNREGDWHNDEVNTAKEQTEYEREKYEKEYKDKVLKDMLEQYASSLSMWSIESLKKMRKELMKKKGWDSDPFTYGQVRAIETQIGLKQDKK